jgi:hypothetical protein
MHDQRGFGFNGDPYRFHHAPIRLSLLQRLNWLHPERSGGRKSSKRASKFLKDLQEGFETANEGTYDEMRKDPRAGFKGPRTSVGDMVILSFLASASFHSSGFNL